MDFKYRSDGSPSSNRPTSVEDYANCNPSFTSPPAFDAAGNTTSFGTPHGGVPTHFYDGESRLVEVRNVSGQSLGQYTYDAANRRVKKVTASGTVHYVWEGSRVIAEYDGATGVVLTEYVYAGGRMLAQETGGKVTYYHQDRLSARLLTDGAGKVVAQMSHEPFGEKLLEREEVNKWRFTSYERDAETGTDYAVNRQYAMNIGRFMRPDPVAGSIANPQSLNRYCYVANDPVNLVDPEGLLIISPSIIQSISDWYYNVMNVSAGGSSIDPGGWGLGGGGFLGGGSSLGGGIDLGSGGGGSPQSEIGPRPDCKQLADRVQEFADSSKDLEGFLDLLAYQFTAAKNSSVAEMERAQNTAPRNEYGDTGFKREFQDRSNQVRHFVAGFIAGARFGSLPARIFMNGREDPNPGGTNDADIALNLVSTDLGGRYVFAPRNDPRRAEIALNRIRKDLGSEIRQRVCE